MISIIANSAMLGGASISLFAILIRYLIPLWPAEGVDPTRVQFHLELLQYSGLTVALVGALLIAWKMAARARKIRITMLVVCVAVLAAFAATRGNPETKPRSENADDAAASAQASRYHFSEDWVTENTTNWSRILRSFKGKADVHALEIGSFEGRSALWFLENILTHPTDSITCVDIWVGPYEKLFDDNVTASPEPNKVIKIKRRSDEALRKLKPNSFDFIYVDGSHIAKDVLMDAVLAWDLLKPGGYIIFDDYNWYGPRSWLVENYTPKIAIDSFMKVFGPYLELVDRDYQVVIRKKTNPDHVPLDTYKSIQAFLVELQQVLR
jgi:predicted O-methyltransferase YrrM